MVRNCDEMLSVCPSAIADSGDDPFVRHEQEPAAEGMSQTFEDAGHELAAPMDLDTVSVDDRKYLSALSPVCIVADRTPGSSVSLHVYDAHRPCGGRMLRVASWQRATAECRASFATCDTHR